MTSCQTAHIEQGVNETLYLKYKSTTVSHGAVEGTRTDYILVQHGTSHRIRSTLKNEEKHLKIVKAAALEHS